MTSIPGRRTEFEGKGQGKTTPAQRPGKGTRAAPSDKALDVGQQALPFRRQSTTLPTTKHYLSDDKALPFRRQSTTLFLRPPCRTRESPLYERVEKNHKKPLPSLPEERSLHGDTSRQISRAEGRKLLKETEKQTENPRNDSGKILTKTSFSEIQAARTSFRLRV